MVQGENQLQATAPSDGIIVGIRSLLFSEASPTAVVPCGSKEEKQSGKEGARVLRPAPSLLRSGRGMYELLSVGSLKYKALMSRRPNVRIAANLFS